MFDNVTVTTMGLKARPKPMSLAANWHHFLGESGAAKDIVLIVLIVLVLYVGYNALKLLRII